MTANHIPITADLSNVVTMTSTKKCEFSFPKKKPKAREGHILEGLTHSSLIYDRKMCDSGYKTLFTHTNIHIIKELKKY